MQSPQPRGWPPETFITRFGVLLRPDSAGYCAIVEWRRNFPTYQHNSGEAPGCTCLGTRAGCWWPV